MSKRKRRAQSGLTRPRTAFELSILIAATLSIVAIVGGLVASGLSSDDEVRLVATITTVRTSPNGDIVGVRIRNAGGASASEVLVRVTSAGEEAEVMIDRVAKRGEEEAEVILPAGTGRTARARVVSYVLP